MTAVLEMRSPVERQHTGVEYMLPVGKRIVATDYGLKLPDGQAPKCVALLANGFPDSERFLAKLADALKPLWPDTRFRPALKASADQLNIGIPEKMLEELAGECDAAVIAWGHCGSCTSGVTRDALAFTSRGMPNVTLICDIFWDYSAWLGTAMGLKGIPRLQIPFPLAGTPEDHQRDWARRLAPQVIAALAAA